ncbi:carbohydrate ABC transporter permease [Acidithiobacillus sp. M4-SHS-6]|uniref:carbohydrate ABC transporter permease n=1 Tax=Acidithiobacillus sp. M4-SHS-6 TaxID=3383024 RepID=UPI0039BDCC4C
MSKYDFKKTIHALVVFLILAIILFPVYWMVSASLKTDNEIFSIPPIWLWKPTLQSYIYTIEKAGMPRALLVSLIVTGGSILLGLLVSAPAAYGIARFNFKGRKEIWFWYVTNWMLVPMVVLIPFYLVASKLNLINNPILLILIFQVFVVPLMVWLLVDQFRSIPIVLEEAAKLDGLNRLGIFLRISLPLTKPGIVVAMILSAIFAWNDLLYAFILMPGQHERTASTIAIAYLGGYLIPWSKVMASGVMICAPVVIAGVIIHKHIARGLTLGAVK